MIKLILQILEKFACKHKWLTHAKKEYSYDKKEIVEGTEYWFEPDFETTNYSENKEVLICEKCGKIEHISY